MKYMIDVRGERHEWGVVIPEAQAKAMREDGFAVREVVNTVPHWIAALGLTAPWCMAQDMFDLPSIIWRKLRRRQP